MKKLSSKTLPKIQRARYLKDNGGYRWDCGNVCFDNPGKRFGKDKEERE